LGIIFCEVLFQKQIALQKAYLVSRIAFVVVSIPVLLFVLYCVLLCTAFFCCCYCLQITKPPNKPKKTTVSTMCSGCINKTTPKSKHRNCLPHKRYYSNFESILLIITTIDTSSCVSVHYNCHNFQIFLDFSCHI
jgi:hypothetical protein